MTNSGFETDADLILTLLMSSYRKDLGEMLDLSSRLLSANVPLPEQSGGSSKPSPTLRMPELVVQVDRASTFELLKHKAKALGANADQVQYSVA